MKKIALIVVVILVGAFIALTLFLSPVIKQSVNRIVPSVLGVPVKLSDVDIRPLRGIIRISGLEIGNPEGFKTENLFAMESLNIDLQMSSLFSDTIVVRLVEVIGPKVTYEKTLTSSNVGALQEQLAGGKQDEVKAEEAPAEKASDESPEPAAAPGKKVVIEKFVLDNGQVNLSFPGMMGTAVPLPLPRIELTDIGKEKDQQGASLTDIIGRVFGAIFSTVGDVVVGSGKLLGDGAKKVGEGAMAVGGAAVEGVSAVGGAAAEGAAVVGGAAVDGAAAVGGAALDAGKAVGKGVAGAVSGVANLFGGKSDDEKGADAAAETAEPAAE